VVRRALLFMHLLVLHITFWGLPCQSGNNICLPFFEPLSDDLGVEAVAGADVDGL